MSNFVLDSSFVLAVLFEEPLDVDALVFLDGAMMSSVNFAEVWTKLHQVGILQSSRIEGIFGLLNSVETFTPAHARTTGLLHDMTKHAGLSLGNRACLALALEHGAEAVTTDRAWARVDVGCPIRIVR